MGLLSSLFSRSRPDDGVPPEADAADSVVQARARARQRLMGAVVLVGAGIIGFPLLFETQPRPIPVDVPIEIPRKETAAPLSLPTARPSVVQAPGAASVEPTGVAAGRDKPAQDIITETAAEAGLPAASAAVGAARIASRTAERAADKVEDKDGVKPDAKPDAKPSKTVLAAADAARAQALLEGKAVASAPTGNQRFIVQIGAFADPALAQQTRLKVERLGLVTYTHVAQTADGARTRVRVGPVTTRHDAEKMAAKIKAAGMPAAILSL